MKGKDIRKVMIIDDRSLIPLLNNFLEKKDAIKKSYSQEKI